MTDYSLAPILFQYINKKWRIIQGKATTEELNSTILHICFSHMINLNRQSLQKPLKSRLKQVNTIRNVCMQCFARVIECRFLEELQKLVLIGKTIFCSPNLTEG